MKPLLLFCALLILRPLYAQVTVQTLIPPPYSPYLYDYQEQFADRNAIVLTNTSRQAVTLMLRGELTGRTNGVRVYTSPNYRPARPIELQPGQSQRFTLAEGNQDYLDRKNLEVAGVDNATQTQILTTGLLPPGSYDLCLLAYRYDNGQPVGTPYRGCTVLNITYLEPPRLVQPTCGRDLLIRPNEPNQTLFSWTPPVGNIGGARLTYDFYLVKVPPGQNPNDAINNAIDRRVGNPFIERDLTTTSFNYGVAEPPLTEGDYAWRVIARDPDGRTVFQNQGRSNYCTFTTRNAAAPPVAPAAAVLAQQPAKPKLPTGPMRTMMAVAPGVSPCVDVTAPADNAPVAGNYQNQTVKIGKFDLTIDDIAADGGGYTGKGRIRWNGVPVRVSFTTIQINAAKQVIAGYANGIDDAFREPGVDLASGNLSDLSNLTGPAVKTYVDHLKNNLYDQGKAAVAVPLPLGYDAGSGLIGINYMRFTPTGADMGLVFNMEMPEANSYLALAGVGICMDPDRLIPNNALLYLLKDFTVPFTPLTFKTGNLAPANPTGTFAELTAAEGLKRIHGELALNLGSSMLQLDDGNGNVVPGDVTATLTTDFTKWADWVADVKLPPAFTLAPLAGFTLKGVSVQYDHSDLRNSPTFAPPTEYTGERGPTFQGLYLNELQVLLPKSFAGQNGNRTGFAAKNCLFASGEFTGRLAPTTNPLLDYNVGSMGNWGFSIDDFEILFVQNRFERGGMNGKIQFPISTDYFTYTTTLRDNLKNLQFVVQPKPGGYTIPLWAADMSLEETSHILVGLQNSNPVMDMRLNGKIQINTAKVSTAVALALPKLFFENFTVSNQNSPGAASGGGVYVNPGSWKLVGGIFRDTPSDAPVPGARSGGPFAPDAPEPGWVPGNDGGLAGFPIEIAPPKAVANANGMGVELGAYVSLGEASANIMQANGFVQILGKITLDPVKKRPTPSFGGIHPTRFGIKGSFGGGEVSAAIDLYYDDATYGNGFRGVGQVKIPALATVEATVQFGKVSGFYYAYADASVDLDAGGIPVAPPTPLLLSGFKGGFYYNMTPANWVTPTAIANKTAPQKPTPGYTNSGVSYRPQRGGWGIKAGVYLALADKHLLTSLVEVEASFNGTALSKFSLRGKANVLDTDGNLNTPDNAMVRADAIFEHDVAQKSYVFGTDVSGKFLTTTFTIPIRAHFDPRHWHVKVGFPENPRMSATLIDFDKGPVKAYLGASAYVAFGNDLSGIPPLPEDVAKFLVTGENPTTADAVQQQRQSEFDAVNSSGTGNPLGGKFQVLLGAELKGSLRVNVLVLAVHADAIVGFDAAISMDQTCGGSGTPPPGLNGWYGTAQLYAYLNGGIDIHVDLFGIADGDFQLCELTAGALFQGGVPNPTWGDGRVRARGSVLGGLVSFDASAHVAFGEKCQPVYTGEPLSLTIIQELRPTAGATNVATDQTLSAVFNVSMNQEYTVHLPDKSTRTYRFRLGAYSLTYKDAGGRTQPFTGLASPVWANNNQLLLLKMNSGQLPSRRPHTFSVTATIEQQQPNGSFVYLFNGANQRVETKTVSFTTGDQPDEIRFENIAYQYPLSGQLYCLKRQVPQGLVAGPLPNEALTKPGYRYEAVFVPKEPGASLRVPFTYQTGNADHPSQVVFALPLGLQNEKTYRLELHRISPISTMLLSGNRSSSAGVQEGIRQAVSNSSGIQGRAVIRQNTLVGQVGGSNISFDKTLYSTAFRTSRYNTFAEKLAALQFAPTSYIGSTSFANYFTFDLIPAGKVENFEDTELFGYNSALRFVPPMIDPSPLSPADESYPHESWVYRNVYQPLQVLTRYSVRPQFTLFSEMNSRNWLLDYPMAAMRSKRGAYVLSFGQRPITSVLGREPVLVATGKGAVAAAPITPTGERLIRPTTAVLNLFVLNPEPTRGYKFYVQRDRISYFDWQAVEQFGTALYRALQQELKLEDQLRQAMPKGTGYRLSFKKFLKNIDVWTSSPTLVLSAVYGRMNDLPNDLINRYPVPTGPSFGTGRDFVPRANGSRGAVRLMYTPYPTAARWEGRKEFVFKTPTSSAIYLK
ncbi:hypothetical protein [Spirosoma rhododendri]|uniref:TANFOR domain-containing protein n=1 Tax=Spirosoma rhododendri TaxID=2728024 RepID=A0A7L5DJG4_9BACT|nr:hypothetical protein [Spirosoma rhododendri]QJD77263.1 hypothetical protein HH216_01625 [Spirosoma rhododendri]